MPDRASILGLLPRGTLPVGAGLMVVGAGSYAHLAVAGHTLPASAMAAMAVLWSVVYLLALGVFLPVEQEMSRLVAARTAVGEGAGPVVRRGAALTAAILAVMLVAIAAAARPLADRLFGGDIAMVAVLASALCALAIASVSRGTLAGQGKFGAYGRQLAFDGGSRVALAGALGAAGLRSAVAFGLILTIAPLMAVTATLGPMLADLRPGPAAPWKTMGSRLGLLITTMLLAQIIINAAVVSVRLLSPDAPALAGAMLTAVVLARVPLFVSMSVQTSLLPGLAGAVSADDQVRFRRLVPRGCLIVTILGIAGGLPATVLGPWLSRVLFGVRPILGQAAFGWLAAGTLFYMLAMVLGQAAMSLSRHRDQVLAWLTGAAVLAVVTISPGGIVPGEARVRVVAAYALGSFTAALALAMALMVRAPRADRSTAASHTAPGPHSLGRAVSG